MLVVILNSSPFLRIFCSTCFHDLRMHCMFDCLIFSFSFLSICIFCGDFNEKKSQETLDGHYAKSCPMLKKCTNCSQVGFQLYAFYIEPVGGE